MGINAIISIFQYAGGGIFPRRLVSPTGTHCPVNSMKQAKALLLQAYGKPTLSESQESMAKGEIKP